jgi:hypothetical protein
MGTSGAVSHCEGFFNVLSDRLMSQIAIKQLARRRRRRRTRGWKSITYSACSPWPSALTATPGMALNSNSTLAEQCLCADKWLERTTSVFNINKKRHCCHRQLCRLLLLTALLHFLHRLCTEQIRYEVAFCNDPSLACKSFIDRSEGRQFCAVVTKP